MRRRLLVCGIPASGKTYCLKGLKDHEKVLFLNCEPSKGMDLPFKNKFIKKLITNPVGQIMGENSYLTQAGKSPDQISTIVIDSLTFLMDMYETLYVNTAPAKDKFNVWGAYSDFFKNLLEQKLSTLPQDVIFTAHVADKFDELAGSMDTRVPVKGNVGKKGAEAYFNNIVYTKRVKLKELEKYQNDLLHITETDEMLGFKHVIQTRLTKDTINEKIRSSDDMWDVKETYIDGNVQLVLDRMNEYYGD